MTSSLSRSFRRVNPVFHVRLVLSLSLLAVPAWRHFHFHPQLFDFHTSVIIRSDSRPHNLLRLATWNLRVPFPRDLEKNLSWNDRKYSIASAIARWRPHLLALQEDCYFMSESLMNSETTIGKLSDTYERYGLFNRNGESYPNMNWPENVFTNDGMKDGEHNSVWYDKSRFLAMKYVTQWLSRTPQVAGTSFDEATGRVINCVLLHDKFCDRKLTKTVQCIDFFFCSTHLPSENATRQLWSVKVLSRIFSKYREDFTNVGSIRNNLMMILSGDFNSAPGSDTYEAMKGAGFVDLRELSQEGKSVEEYTATTNDWYETGDSLIDHVWIYLGFSANEILLADILSVKHVPVSCCDLNLNDTSPKGSFNEDIMRDRVQMHNRTASDHLMVIVDVALI